ncbi:hypothetical protein AGMMS49936_11150 [Endomicrobiia bacterium]|nr:hypothetical protein AGMMS49936_11150 [Endomicrobiia bacterium]
MDQDQDAEKIISGKLLKFVRFTLWVLCLWTILFAISCVILFVINFLYESSG